MRIFIASSSELNEERDSLELLLYRENFKPVKWEDIDHSITKDRFQSIINEDHLLTSDIVIFMIKSRLGEYTFEEFQESYKNLGLKIDKIYVYFFDIDKNIIPKKELRKIMDLEDFLEEEGKLYQRVKDFKDLENHFLKQIKHLQSTFTKDESRESLKTQIISQHTNNSQIKRICIYTSSPLNTSIKFEVGVIKKTI